MFLFPNSSARDVELTVFYYLIELEQAVPAYSYILKLFLYS